MPSRLALVSSLWDASFTRYGVFSVVVVVVVVVVVAVKFSPLIFSLMLVKMAMAN